MSEKGFSGTSRGKIIAAVVGVIAVAGIIAAVLLLNGNTYRSIIAKEVSGTVNVVGESNNGQVYAGQRLYGGDDVSVMAQSSLTMLMDNDKYLFAEANTHFMLESQQSDRSSRIKIILDKGSVLSELRSKLAAYDSYDVDTPNSTMSVRGTKFNVTVYTENDIVYTLLEVSDGAVLTQLHTVDGAYNGVEQTFMPGESALITGDKGHSEFILSKTGETVWHLDLSKLPANGTDRLIALLRSITEENDQPPATESSTEAAPVTTETSADETTTDTSEENTTEATTSVTDDTTVAPVTETVTEPPVYTTAAVTSAAITTTTTTTTTARTTVRTTARTTARTTVRTSKRTTTAPSEHTSADTTTVPVQDSSEDTTTVPSPEISEDISATPGTESPEIITIITPANVSTGDNPAFMSGNGTISMPIYTSGTTSKTTKGPNLP